jgi:hypothetical protein
MTKNARAAYARLRGDLDAAGDILREAADEAVASGDHPIMAMVALGVGTLALDRGDIADARSRPTVPRPRDQRLDCFRLPLQQRLDAAVAAIAHPAVYAVLARLVLQRNAVADALHATADTNLPRHHAAELS